MPRSFLWNLPYLSTCSRAACKPLRTSTWWFWRTNTSGLSRRKFGGAYTRTWTVVRAVDSSLWICAWTHPVPRRHTTVKQLSILVCRLEKNVRKRSFMWIYFTRREFHWKASRNIQDRIARPQFKSNLHLKVSKVVHRFVRNRQQFDNNNNNGNDKSQCSL